MRKRQILLVGVPGIVLLIALGVYLEGGRYVETENAYLKSDKIPISAEIPGSIQKVLVQENQSVKAGDVLFQLDPAPYQVAALKAKASLEKARVDLSVRKGGADASVLEQNPSYLLAKAELERANLNLSHVKVRAPMDGVVTRLPKVGQYVAPGNVVMNVISNRELWIEANFNETDLEHVIPGQPVQIRIDMYPDKKWQGAVESVSPATGAEFSMIPAQNVTGNWVKITQRVAVRIQLKPIENQPILRSGLSCWVQIDTGQDHRRVAQLFS